MTFLSLGLATLAAKVCSLILVSGNQLDSLACSNSSPSLIARDLVDQISIIAEGISSSNNIPANLWLEDVHQVLGLSEENSPWKYSSLSDNIYYNELSTCDSHYVAVSFEQLSEAIVGKVPKSSAEELINLQNAIAKLQVILFRLPYECDDFRTVASASIDIEADITSALNQHGIKKFSFPRVPSSALYCEKNFNQNVLSGKK
jgi:hypothetical protein